ncbi:MAG: twin-arginine translocation signal domain-containing protein, partial [Anaerolineae bacterium]|nr:twin-arginine translocation signal domain-containing protein [Anaerolineae bacterium]
MKRRDFLRGSLVGLGAALGGGLPFLSSLTTIAQDEGTSSMMSLDVKGAILNVHDPVVMKYKDYYYL